MSKLQRYSSYKESGVEWLGEIPEHWELVPGMKVYRENKRKNIGMIEDRVLSLSYGNIIVKPIEKLVGLVPESFETYQIVQTGDIIIRCMDLQNDKTSLRTGFSKNHGIITSAYLNLNVLNGHAEYLYYYLHALDLSKVIYKFGTGLRQNLSFIDFKRLPIVFPPVDEQYSIVNFLNKKSDQIDQAISQKEQLIELLKERRQIVINDAVTKGLNPNLSMKDSGIEWIGEIPEHWEVIKFKHLFYEKKKTHDISLNCGSISFGKVVEKDDEKIPISTKASYQVLNKGEFLINPLNLNYDLKSLRIALSELDVVVSSGYLIVKSRVDMAKEYFKWLLHRYDIAFMKTLGAGVRQTLNFNDIGESLIINPPKDEQLQVAIYIEDHTSKIDAAIKLQQNYITKLKEYKATLIDSVVTGKVRVA